MTLGEQIRQARENSNLSQEDLAAQLGVSRQAVSKWENDSSTPQGINREMLSQILGLELSISEETAAGKRSGVVWLGWGLAAVLALLLCVSLWFHIQARTDEDKEDKYAEEQKHQLASPVSGEDPDDTSFKASARDRAIKSVCFYDGKQNPVDAEAGWYNAAGFESILIQWEGDSPSNIKMFCTPTGTETEEMTELLLTKSILDGDSAALLSADVLEEGIMGHVYFELDYGNTVIVSDIYNVINDPDALEQ